MEGCKSMLDKDDTINKLHDDLLHRIVDLLPMKDALRTSVVSSRWRNLWRSISNIDLDEFGFPSEEDMPSLLDFIDRILVHHDSSDIKRFVSCKACNIDAAHIHRWISEVIKHNVEELRLGCGLCLDKPCILPLCLFKSESLTVCEVGMGVKSDDSIILGSDDSSLFSVHLPSLKRLKLSKVVFLNHHSIEQFFSNIPKLQQLCLYDCNWENVDRLSINIPTLEEVDVRIQGTIERSRNLDCQVMIISPSLTSFNCKTTFYIDVLLSNPSLSLNVILDADFDDDVGDRLALIRILESIEKSMTLHVQWTFCKWLKLHGIGVEEFPLFDNLKHLEISADYCSYGDVTLKRMFMLLHKTPILESLIITLPDKNNDDWKTFGWHFEDDWSNDGDVPSCVTNQIKKFSISSKSDIYRFEVYSTAIGLIRYFLNHSPSLKTLEVNWSYWHSRSTPTQDIIDDIQRHPRFSEQKNFSCSRNIIPKPLDFFSWSDDDGRNFLLEPQ